MRHKLQAVPIRVMEIHAVWIPRTTTDLHPVLFQLGFERFVRAALNVEGQMVEIVAGRQGSITLLLKQGDTLVATVQKCLGIVFPVDRHTQQLRVELLGTRHILHMQNNVIEAVDLDHRSFPPRHRHARAGSAQQTHSWMGMQPTPSYVFCCILYSNSSRLLRRRSVVYCWYAARARITEIGRAHV